MTQNLVTGFGGSVVLGYYQNDIFNYQNKFPRKKKKELRKQMPWITFHKSQIDYVIDKCVPKDWYSDDHSFALTISNKPIDGERPVCFSVTFFDSEQVTSRQIFYKRQFGIPTKNI